MRAMGRISNESDMSDSSFLRQVFSPLYRIFPGKTKKKGKAPVQCTGAFADPYQ